MTPRPITPEDCDALYRQPPRMIACGDHANYRWWLCRYDNFPDPLLGVWTLSAFEFASFHYWFPNAGHKSVPAFIETLPAPVPVKARAA